MHFTPLLLYSLNQKVKSAFIFFRLDDRISLLPCAAHLIAQHRVGDAVTVKRWSTRRTTLPFPRLTDLGVKSEVGRRGAGGAIGSIPNSEAFPELVFVPTVAASGGRLLPPQSSDLTDTAGLQGDEKKTTQTERTQENGHRWTMQKQTRVKNQSTTHEQKTKQKKQTKRDKKPHATVENRNTTQNERTESNGTRNTRRLRMIID